MSDIVFGYIKLINNYRRMQIVYKELEGFLENINLYVHLDTGT